MSREDENHIIRQCLIAFVSNEDGDKDLFTHKKEPGKIWMKAGIETFKKYPAPLLAGKIRKSGIEIVKKERLKIYGSTGSHPQSFNLIFDLLDNGRDVVFAEALDIVIHGMIFKDGLDTQGINPVLMSSVKKSILTQRYQKEEVEEEPKKRIM